MSRPIATVREMFVQIVTTRWSAVKTTLPDTVWRSERRHYCVLCAVNVQNTGRRATTLSDSILGVCCK